MRHVTKVILILIAPILFFTSCSTHKIVNEGRVEKYRNVEQYFKQSSILNDHFTGFVLYDVDKQEFRVDKNGSKYFTPASNTKLWTFYAALETLGDSIAWMAYADIDEKRVFYPMGDPTFLHPFLDENPRIANYFSDHFQAGDTIYLSTKHYRDLRFGEGWMWDDQSYYFQAEKSVFPIYANTVKLTPNNGQIQHEPSWMNVYADTWEGSFGHREEFQNVYVIPKSQDYSSYMPVVMDHNHIWAYFNSMELHVEFVDIPFEPASSRIIYSMPTRDVYQYYMEESDNLIAEQLLLQCSMIKLGYMSTHDIIDTLLKNEMAAWQDQWNWYDGSGISRYNLVTPNAMVSLMNTMITKYDQSMIEEVLPTGGEGTLKNWYGYTPPRVFAKTGTVKYCHNLTGIIHTEKGNQYTFSFMHNNFNYASSEVKEAMSDVIDIIVHLY
jgi:D-alanyl-D-alanine carboxypeptidase/D-alanyl-D-alanine-endopeptidase (penicillin-binding protein 4)